MGVVHEADLFGAEPVHDPGGKRIGLPPGVMATAVYSGPLDCYRSRLEWVWDTGKPTLAAVMMNPSCAGHLCGDMTLMWVYRWAVRNGFGRLIVVNADDYRAADQMRLAEVAEPCSPENAGHILAAAREADLVVLGYGKPKVKAVRDHGPRMARLLVDAGTKLHAWAVCNCGTPKHPLYLRADVRAMPWSPTDPSGAETGGRG